MAVSAHHCFALRPFEDIPCRSEPFDPSTNDTPLYLIRLYLRYCPLLIAVDLR